jgi:hypothetical protein
MKDQEQYRSPEQARRAYRRLSERIELGEDSQNAVIQKVADMVIIDKLVKPSEMTFHPGNRELLVEYDRQPGKLYRIHKHALSQLCIKDKVRIPAEWVNRQVQNENKEPWRPEMVAGVFTTVYKNTDFRSKQVDDPKFLHRVVGDQLRGFLSRRFNRHIASGRLLRAFLAVCAECGAVPMDGTATDVKVALKCALPHVFEPVPNEFVAFGIEWSNSDFGAGRMQVSMCMWSIWGDRFTVLENGIFRRHIGSVIEEADVEISDATATKEADAQASAIRDTVIEQLSTTNVDKLLKIIAMAHKEELPWDKIKGQLTKFLPQEGIKTLKEALENEIVDLPPVRTNADQEKVPTKWWASQALSWLASRTNDPEKKLDLEKASSAFLEVKDA